MANMMPNGGLLLVTMEPPAALEEEFNDWYDSEHFPQRCALPGFASGTRWACVEGWPRWLALYDLAALSALDTDAYLAVSGANSTPWSRRILPRTLGRRRVTAEQLAPGHAVLGSTAGIARLLVLRHPQAAADGAAAMQRHWAAQEGAVSARVFRDGDGALWTIAGFDQLVTLATLLPAVHAGGGACDLANLYAPYQRG